MKLRPKKIVNLALQGGGSHGAFTWGVLDRLLEEPRVNFEGISGTSAGAMNAVMLAHGLTTGGREGARTALTDFWESVGTRMPWGTASAPDVDLLPAKAMLAVTRVLSPYQLNPLGLNPLREIVTTLIDFERLRAECKIKLFIAATQVSTGRLRLFETTELTADALLASACLPSLHHAIEIDGEAYWDGGYSANPALFPLIRHCKSPDVVLVLIQPLRRPALPVSARDIRQRVTELGFSTTFVREMEEIARAQSESEKAVLPLGRLERRLRKMNFHVIEAGEATSGLSMDSKLDTSLGFLHRLRDEGRRHADIWLERNFRSSNARPSVNLAQFFGGMKAPA